jgi:hypothetical protein
MHGGCQRGNAERKATNKKATGFLVFFGSPLFYKGWERE